MIGELVGFVSEAVAGNGSYDILKTAFGFAWDKVVAKKENPKELKEEITKLLEEYPALKEEVQKLYQSNTHNGTTNITIKTLNGVGVVNGGTVTQTFGKES